MEFNMTLKHMRKIMQDDFAKHGDVEDLDVLTEEYEYITYAVYMEDGTKFIVRLNEDMSTDIEYD